MLECEIGSPSYCLYLCKLENWQLHDIALLFFPITNQASN